MADNTRLNANTTVGDLYASDDVGGVKHTRVKVQYGVDGSATDVSASNRLPVEDFLTQVGKGTIAGHRIIKPLGSRISGIETSALGDMSLVPSVIVLPNPEGIGLEVVSDDTNDNSTGTGIRTLTIHYLDTNFDEQTEVVTLNGTTAVPTVATDIQAIQWMSSASVGSNGVAEGNISLRHLSDTPIYEYIAAGGNQSLTARYTVPNGHKAYLMDWHCSGMKKRIDFYLRATCDKVTRALLSGIFLFQDFEICEKTTSGTLDGGMILFPARCQIKISAQADGANGEGAASFTLLVVAD